MYDTLLKITKRTRPNFWSTTHKTSFENLLQHSCLRQRWRSSHAVLTPLARSDDTAPVQCWRPSHTAMTQLQSSADAPLLQQSGIRIWIQTRILCRNSRFRWVLLLCCLVLYMVTSVADRRGPNPWEKGRGSHPRLPLPQRYVSITLTCRFMQWYVLFSRGEVGV